METDGEELIDKKQENMEAPWGTIMGKHTSGMTFNWGVTIYNKWLVWHMFMAWYSPLVDHIFLLLLYIFC
jgi:hypothetical protein